MTIRSDERQFANASASYGRTTLAEEPAQAADPEMVLILGEVVKAALICMTQISRDLYFQSSKEDASFRTRKAEEEFSAGMSERRR